MLSMIDADDDDVDDDDDDDDDDPSSPFIAPFPPQASLSHAVWSYRYIYIYIYGCLLFLLSRDLHNHIPLCRPVPAIMAPTCAGLHAPTCAGRLCRDGLFASLF